MFLRTSRCLSIHSLEQWLGRLASTVQDPDDPAAEPEERPIIQWGTCGPYCPLAIERREYAGIGGCRGAGMNFEIQQISTQIIINVESSHHHEILKSPPQFINQGL